MLPERIGQYRILKLLGTGGMGAVYEGFQEAIERRVAVKVLHAHLAKRADMATRFINEARAVNRIEHPGLVQVSDYGNLEDGTAFIVMEFLNGETLSQRLQRTRRLSAPDAIRIIRQAASALAAAHAKEIVHRDLKPDNLMIVSNPDAPNGEQVKVLDFGIAKVLESDGDSEANTRADAVLGTPRYMSPEQCKGGGRVDSKSDVYSLGVILYELLAGQPPFPGNAYGELIVKHITEAPPPLASLVEPSCPAELVAFVHHMLAKEREQRPTMRQVVTELDRISGTLTGAFRSVSLASTVSAVVGASSVPSFPGTPSLPGPMPTPVPSTPSLNTGLGGSSPAGASTLASSAGQSQVQPRPRWPIAVAVGSVVGAISVGVVLMLSIGKPQQVVQPPPPKLVPVVDKPVSDVPPPAKKLVHWSLRTNPQGASVIRAADGEVLGSTPISIENLAASGSQKLRVVLNGYVDEVISVDLDKDFEQELQLRRRAGKVPDSKKGKGRYQKGDLTVLD